MSILVIILRSILRSILPTITLMSTQMDKPANGRNYLSANAIKVSELHNLERNYYNHSNYKCKEPEKKQIQKHNNHVASWKGSNLPPKVEGLKA